MLEWVFIFIHFNFLFIGTIESFYFVKEYWVYNMPFDDPFYLCYVFQYHYNFWARFVGNQVRKDRVWRKGELCVRRRGGKWQFMTHHWELGIGACLYDLCMLLMNVRTISDRSTAAPMRYLEDSIIVTLYPRKNATTLLLNPPQPISQ